MTFESELLELSTKTKDYKESGSLLTEEATKFALVMPFLSRVLGYDVFNPNEVVPEFTADVGIRNGEKVDYAIKHNGEIQILIEAKQINANLSVAHANQLYRYFTATNARIGILTNGQVWEFYSDLEKSNIMDQVPFLTIDLTEVDKIPVGELKKFSKESFDLGSVISSAEDLKYLSAFKKLFAQELENPSDEFLRFAAKGVYEGKLTNQRLEGLRPIAVKAVKQVIQERVTGLFQRDLQDATPVDAPEEDDAVGSEEGPEKEIETTLEELKAFHLIRGIMHPDVEPARITFRDTKSYFGMQMDGNARRTWLKLFMDGRKPRFLLPTSGKRVTLDTIEEISYYRDELLESFRTVEASKLGAAGESASVENATESTLEDGPQEGSEASVNPKPEASESGFYGEPGVAPAVAVNGVGFSGEERGGL